MAAGDLLTLQAQIEFNGLLLGLFTPFEGIKLQGWGDLQVNLGNVGRNSRHGSWAGNARVPERVITFDFQMVAELADFASYVDALERATAVPRGSTEYPLVISTPASTRMVYAKCTARVLPEDYLYMAGAPIGVLQWIASDPRRYGLVEQSVTIVAPSGGSDGLLYPLEYPLAYGVDATPNNANCVNAGTTESNPVLTITGPVLTPRVVNSTLNRALEFNIELEPGQTLVIDTNRGTVLLDGVTDRLYTRSNFSVPVEYFELDPGDNNLTLLGAEFSGPGAQVQVTWRSAYL